MPIYDYICGGCQTEFEALVVGNRQAKCPKCQGSDLKKKMSSFAVRSGGKAPAEGGGSKCSGCAGGSCGTCH